MPPETLTSGSCDPEVKSVRVSVLRAKMSRANQHKKDQSLAPESGAKLPEAEKKKRTEREVTDEFHTSRRGVEAGVALAKAVEGHKLDVATPHVRHCGGVGKRRTIIRREGLTSVILCCPNVRVENWGLENLPMTNHPSGPNSLSARLASVKPQPRILVEGVRRKTRVMIYETVDEHFRVTTRRVVRAAVLTR
jgi:hypothetical protein